MRFQVWQTPGGVSIFSLSAFADLSGRRFVNERARSGKAELHRRLSRDLRETRLVGAGVDEKSNRTTTGCICSAPQYRKNTKSGFCLTSGVSAGYDPPRYSAIRDRFLTRSQIFEEAFLLGAAKISRLAERTDGSVRSVHGRTNLCSSLSLQRRTARSLMLGAHLL